MFAFLNKHVSFEMWGVWSACDQEVVVALLIFPLCYWNPRKDFQLINILHTFSLWNKCSKYGIGLQYFERQAGWKRMWPVVFDGLNVDAAEDLIQVHLHFLCIPYVSHLIHVETSVILCKTEKVHPCFLD